MHVRARCRAWRLWLTECVVAIVIGVGVAACGDGGPDQRLEAVKAERAKGDLAAVVLNLKSLLQDYPEHAESRFHLGLAYLETGDYRGAEKEFRRALELQVDPARVLPLLGKALVLQGEARKALSEISADATRDPSTLAGILTVRGLAHIALRQPAEARASFEKALALDPGHVDARLGQARLLAGEGSMEAALNEVDRALLAAPKSGDALMLKGDLLRASRRLEDAHAAYAAVEGGDARYVDSLLAIAALDIAAGKYDDANTRLAAVRKAAPGNLMVSYFKALVHFRKGEFPAARDAIGSVLRAAPNHLPSLLLGGAVEFALGSQELAQTRLRFVLERAPSNAYARRLLIASYTRAGQTHKAMQLLEPALKQGTKDPATLALAGELYLQLNDYEQAKNYFEQAIALDPKNSGARTGLGLSRLAAGEVEAATAALESASELDESKHHADVLLVSTHLQRRQYQQALKAAQGLEAKQPNNPITHNLLAAAYIGMNDIAAARRSLEKALALQPNYTPAALNLAQLDLSEGNKKAARKRFEDMISRDRSNVQAYIALASLGSRIDAQPGEVQAWLEAARREGPGTIQPLVMLARLHFQAGEPKKALEVMEKALISAPDSPEVLELAGQVQLAAGERNRALGTFAKWVSAHPNSAQALYRYATAQVANDDASGAAHSLRKAIQIRPQFPEAQVMLAGIESRSGHHADAISVAVSMQQQNPKSPLGWIVHGDALMAAKEYAQAVKAYEAAVERNRSGVTLVKLHSALVVDGRGSEGEARLKDWIRSQPSDLATQLYLGEFYLKSGRSKDAAAIYERIAAAYPENVLVLNNLAWCYQQFKDARAVETAEKALKLQPENPAVIDTLGWILVDSGDPQRGLELLKKAAQLAPKSPDIRYHYAQGLAKVSDKARAKEELERLLIEFPKFSEGEEAMQLLTRLRGK